MRLKPLVQVPNGSEIEQIFSQLFQKLNRVSFSTGSGSTFSLMSIGLLLVQ